MSFDENDLAENGAGTYGVRCSARGRDAEYDLTSEARTEEYLIQVWPAGPGLGLTVLRASQFLHRFSGS